VAGSFIGLWILYLMVTILAFFGMGAMGLQDETLWEILIQSAFFAALTCMYIKQRDIEKKLDRLLEQREPSAPDKPDAKAPEQPQD